LDSCFFFFLWILMLRQILIQNVDSQHSILSLTLAANGKPKMRFNAF
jgi:hypothetical protein